MPQQYTGKELDPETNLYYYGARYYDPRTQQWQTPDPILNSYLDGDGVYDPTNLSLYTYANNNPVRYTDPYGREVRGVVLVGNVHVATTEYGPNQRWAQYVKAKG